MENIFAKTLLIANPTSQNGKGAQAAVQAQALLEKALGQNALQVIYTEYPKHGVELGAAAQDYTCVIALGGDGVIHEVANGLMRVPQDKRPAFAIIPVGSGNDYAKTLGISEDVEVAVNQIMAANVKTVDVGKVNGEYYLETLSWGLCAAIALGTMELRKTTTKTGMALYAKSGYNQIVHHAEDLEYEISVDGGEVQAGAMKLMVANQGCTYGGGFKIAPDASLFDGKFNLCICRAPITKAKAMIAFLTAKTGKHGWCKQIVSSTGSTATIRFKEDPPCQIDGEKLTSEDATYEVSVVSAALRVCFAF